MKNVLDVTSNAPRKKQERQFYQKKYFTSELKADFDAYYGSLQDPKPPVVKARNQWCEMKYNMTSEEFKANLREELDAEHEQSQLDWKERGSWNGDAETYAK